MKERNPSYFLLYNCAMDFWGNAYYTVGADSISARTFHENRCACGTARISKYTTVTRRENFVSPAPADFNEGVPPSYFLLK
jgi:hypothetical protein